MSPPGKKCISLSCITGISCKNTTLGSCLKALSSENKDFILNFLEKILFHKYHFLKMLQKNSVQCRKLWVIWSSLRTKIFNVRLYFCHSKVSSIFRSSSCILHNPRTYFKNIMSRYCCLMELPNGNNNIWKILVKNKFDIYIQGGNVALMHCKL